MNSLSRHAVVLGVAAIATAGAASGALGVGDSAPDFTLPSTGGGEATLSSYVGEMNVVLAFFPKAFTGG